MSISIGARLRSPASTCEVVVTRAPSVSGELECAGAVMTADPVDVTPTAAEEAPEILLGKRYGTESAGIEVLCVKPGAGPLTFAGEELLLKAAKPLPASD